MLKFSATLEDASDFFSPFVLLTGLWTETPLYKINSNTLRTKKCTAIHKAVRHVQQLITA